ncbi:MAG: hypothetical protein NTV70_25345 [Acidobacteria bacterium]|nr:hypothetical protein [Acidobacteriota bacterium]
MYRSDRRWLIAVVLLTLTACSSKPEPEPVRVLGEAFAGPMTAVLRQDLSPRSPEVAQVQHGDKVELIDRRRRFFRVRTASGAIGWIDGRQLLNAKQLDQLRQLSETNKDAVPIGQATVYEALNLHNEPNRGSPSFTQIPEKGIVDVLGYRYAPRVPYQPPPLLVEKPAAPKAAKKKKGKGKDKEVEPPPLPPAPELPDDWEELSQADSLAERTEVTPGKTDDWTLVRLTAGPHKGKSGWALSGMLVMAIPDEVAQYSEGHRIMAYWPLGTVDDEGTPKNHYLWATMSQKGQPFQFDGFRIFLYNHRRHRYEQAYREKNLEGFFPLDVVRPGRKPDYLSEFTVVTRKDGQKTARTFAFLGYRVVKLEEKPFVEVAAPAANQPATATQAPPAAVPAVENRPWYKRLLP